MVKKMGGKNGLLKRMGQAPGNRRGGPPGNMNMQDMMRSMGGGAGGGMAQMMQQMMGGAGGGNMAQMMQQMMSGAGGGGGERGYFFF